MAAFKKVFINIIKKICCMCFLLLSNSTVMAQSVVIADNISEEKNRDKPLYDHIVYNKTFAQRFGLDEHKASNMNSGLLAVYLQIFPVKDQEANKFFAYKCEMSFYLDSKLPVDYPGGDQGDVQANLKIRQEAIKPLKVVANKELEHDGELTLSYDFHAYISTQRKSLYGGSEQYDSVSSMSYLRFKKDLFPGLSFFQLYKFACSYLQPEPGGLALWVQADKRVDTSNYNTLFYDGIKYIIYPLPADLENWPVLQMALKQNSVKRKMAIDAFLRGHKS